MEYRRQTHKERGFDNEHDELIAAREYVQSLIQEPEELVDTLLIITNICESKALLHRANPTLSAWFTHTSEAIRKVLESATHGSLTPKVNQVLEHPYIYFPEIVKVH